MTNLPPPFDLSAERAVLSSVLFHGPVALAEIQVPPEDFYNGAHRRIFKTALDLDAKGHPVDLVTVTQKLLADNVLDKCGGAVYVTDLHGGAVSLQSAAYMAQKVREMARRRKVITAAQQLELGARNPDHDIDDLVGAFDSSLVQSTPKGALRVGDTMREAFERLESLYEGKVPPGVPTGLPQLDKTIQLCGGDLIVLAGRPGMGKTALGLTIALGACDAGKNVLFVSLEMPRDQVENRAISQISGVPLHLFRSGEFRDQDWGRLTHAAGKLKECPLWIDARPGQTVAEIKAEAARLKRKGGVDLLLIDHLGKIRHGDEKTTEYARVTGIARAVKDAARSLDIPVVLLSQLSRRVEQRMPPIPSLGDLRDSGAVEEEADTVLLAYRQDYYAEQGTLDPNSSEHAKKGYFRKDYEGMGVVLVGKSRHGPTGKVVLRWVPKTARFENE